MYGTKAAFDYVLVGGRCTYETNKIFEFPKQLFYATNSLYTTEHDGIRCDFMDNSSYLEVLFDEIIESNEFYMLQLVYYIRDINKLNLKVTWKKEDAINFCDECYENIELEVSNNKFLYANIDLRQNSEWVGKITNLRFGVCNTEPIPLFIKYFSVYSPTIYKCTKSSCPYYNKYSHPCDAGKDLHIILGKYLDKNNILLVSKSNFLFSVYGVEFVIEFESGYYFLDTILNKLAGFFDSMPIPYFKIIKDNNKIKLSCDYVKPTIKHTELSERLGFFDPDGSESYTYIIENSGESDYIDVAGNLRGIYTVSDLKNLNFNKLFSIGFSDDKDFYPKSSVEFLDKTVIFYTLTASFDGYINYFEIYCKVFSGGGKILIYRRSGDTYKVVNSYSLIETASMSKHTIDWACKVYKGDVIGIYNLELSISKRTTGPVNNYGLVSGYSASINKTNSENISFSSVSIYAYFKQPAANDVPVIAFYNETSYVDKLIFSSENINNENYFNIIFDNTFNYEIVGCQINVKDIGGVITEIPGEISDIECLSDNVFSYTNNKIQLDQYKSPPIDLSTIDGRDALKYSWDKYIIGVYEHNDCSCTFIPGSVFFYYEFPSIIDICMVLIVSAEKEMCDKYLLKVLDNTKMSPSFSNSDDVIILDSQMNNKQFIIEDNKTKGVGFFVYNYEELPNINFSEIVLYTKIGNIPEYIIEIAGVMEDGYTIPFVLDTIGHENNVCVGCHIKELIININFITNNKFLNFENINIYSSCLPDDYFISGNGAGEGILTIYNTRSKALDCCLLDYNVNLLDNLIYEYDFDNDVSHMGFVPTQYTHSQFHFISTNYTNNEYITYALKNMINVEDFFVTKFYNFKTSKYDDWYVPYDYIVSGYDGEFVYIDGKLKLRPLMSEAIRWFNYINVNEFYNDIDIELKFDYTGNIEDFVFIGMTCCDRNYDNYLKFYCVFQTSSEYGLEFKLAGESEPTYYQFSAVLGRDAGLKIRKRGDVWTFFCFYSGIWHELTTFSLFDAEILVSISTFFNAPHVKGNVIAEFISCEVKASKIIYGKKIWYTINDGLNYIYSGNVLDDSRVLDNFDKSLTFCRDYTIKKFVYSFNTTSVKYLKFANVSTKSIKITEIKCYIDDVLIPIKQGYVSYSDDLFSGVLDGETSYLDDNIIISYDLSNTICKGDNEILSVVGVDFGNNTGVNKAVLYYIEETGPYDPCRLMYSYDNIVYYDVYDNFSLFSRTPYTVAHYLFNEFTGYKGKNEITYNFISNNQYSTDFSEEGVLDYKWIIPSPYEVDSGGVWFKHLTGAENLYSTFSIDGDFVIDVYFDSFSNYSSGEASVILKAIFKNNNLQYEYVYIKQRFDNHYIYTRNNNYDMESGRISGRLRIKRIGSVFYFYYRKYGTTWYEVGSHDYGYDYIYPVAINVYLSGANSFDLRISKVLITKGTGISDKDLELLESPSLNTLFVQGRQFSSNDTYAIAGSWSMTKPAYPFSFSWLGGIASSIPSNGFLVNKPCSIGLTYEERDLSLWWFSEYFVKFKIDNVLLYSSIVNTISSVSVENYNVDKQLFSDTSDPTIKAIYKSRYDVNMLIDETFKTGEGTFDKVHENLNLNWQPGYLFDGFAATTSDIGVEKVTSNNWVTCDTAHGIVRIHDDRLYFYFSGLTSSEYPTLDSSYTVSGNFDMQTDFTICSGVDSDECGLDLTFEIDSSNLIYVKASYDSSDVFMYGVTVSGEVTRSNVPRTSLYGKMRIARVDNSITVYYKDGNESNWTEFNVFSSFPIDAGKISLGFYSSTSSNPSGYFDNFMLSTTKDVDCQLGCLEDDFTGANGSMANINNWTTVDATRGNVRIQDNKLSFSFFI